MHARSSLSQRARVRLRSRRATQTAAAAIDLLTIVVEDHPLPLGWMLLQAIPTWVILTAWRYTVLAAYGGGGDDDDSDSDSESDDDNDDDAADKKPKAPPKPPKGDDDPFGLALLWKIGPPVLFVCVCVTRRAVRRSRCGVVKMPAVSLAS